MGKSDHQDIIAVVRAEDLGALQKLLSRPKGKSSKISLGVVGPAKKLNVNGQDDDGLTPLHHAALSGNVRIISLLLENGAVVNVPDKKVGGLVLCARVLVL